MYIHENTDIDNISTYVPSTPHTQRLNSHAAYMYTV